MIEARKAIAATGKPVQRRVGSRPPLWSDGAPGPPLAICRRTLRQGSPLGEAAVLAVVAVEVRHHGACTLTIGHIAALAGVGRSTVKRALREAHALGVIRIKERRLSI